MPSSVAESQGQMQPTASQQAASASQGSTIGGTASHANTAATLGKPKDVTFAKLCDLKFQVEVKM